MDPLLLALVLVLFAAAIGFGGLAWHMLREERRRSAARVAALSVAIDTTIPTTPTAGVGELFAPQRSAAAKGNPFIKGAVGAAMALVLIIVVASANRGVETTTNEGPSTLRESQATSARGTAPLELISMRHTRNGDTLTVTGLVRNPRNGASIARVNAVVLAFNRAGVFVASGRAALDFTTLDPGDESPFVVTIPSVSEVGRYRVSFRTDAGVVRHVDRRSDPTGLAAAVHLR
jgi:hypothetical protein